MRMLRLLRGVAYLRQEVMSQATCAHRQCHTVKPKPRKRIDYSKAYTDNNTITAVRAMSEFLLKPSDLEGLRKTARRSPYSDPNSPPLMVYLRADVEQKAIEVWGSMAALQREMQKREKNSDAQKQYTFRYKKALKEYRKFFGEGGVEPPFIFGSGKPQDRSYLEEPVYSLFSGSGRVVMMAIGINTLNFVFKLVAWVFTGSASMFSEAIHSLADTINQSILAFGIHQSIRKPNPDHPYGFSNMRYVSSLVSGVGIFCVGAGLSIYHGVLGLIDPQPMESFFWVCTKPLWRSRDPSVNVVLLEDAAAVLGVAIAATCMGLTSLTGNPIYDAVGSITIGGLLAMVSAFLIYTNAEALIGRSIPPDQLDRIMHSLEDDVMVRAIHDIKATEMGLNIVRFKAEVDFDGREVTRSYLDKVDLEALLQMSAELTVSASQFWCQDLPVLPISSSKDKLVKTIYRDTFRYKKALKEYRKFFGEGGVEPPFIFGSGKPQDRSYLEEPVYSLFSGSGRVVMMAIGINTLNFVFKLVAWVFTGSASMFSEAIHSLADTINQSILAFGIHQSIRKPNPDHPYGFSNMRYVSSLVSGVGIFCVGAGLSIYHGVLGLIDPQPMESFFWVCTKPSTLLAATAHIRQSARAQGMQFMEYVWRSRDPSVNVVLLEDAAAVLGVAIAATCMGLTSLTGNPIYDAVGSITIGGLLAMLQVGGLLVTCYGCSKPYPPGNPIYDAMGSITIGGLLAMVSAFLIYTNAEALIGRSIPPDQLDRIMHSLEDDVMVRAIHDIKATEMGLNIVRFKAEVDFDGREVTRSYLDKVDLEALLQEVQQYQTIEDMEGFMLRHGENIIDILGAEVDRLETQLKKKNPEVKHVDLEIL
uniref:Proton-coupled zinc antiporter SLC30A9, mitochondrial n=1 Tax=Branchiostoma floridae TaxID=7739 RepID=C3YZA2_BRAFL|eukprot:XP_002598161.1 hypothetical protein BRAFLDRAFT_82946 [Branchiostoma floridae]